MTMQFVHSANKVELNLKIKIYDTKIISAFAYMFRLRTGEYNTGNTDVNDAVFNNKDFHLGSILGNVQQIR